ncbi:hypothetical protein CAEBREN_08098 [Caenorhabditis brenneri]|uniref:Uncharacterized protein n=1 Tax=Caenorhabditis brenneri TaxID=135651 RepID=G0NZJ3_CAEBE|nr:hypothetical protein CAEBREN_08098 [Caenorhabditis brenneri]
MKVFQLQLNFNHPFACTPNSCKITMPAQEFNMGNISADKKRWTIDPVKSTATHEAWEPTTHRMSKEDFSSIIRHPSMIAQSKKVNGKKSGLSVFWSISGGYVMSGDEKYPVKRFNILDRRDRTIVIYWPLTKRENVHEKRTETFSDGEADDLAAPVVPVHRAPRGNRATATSRVAKTRATPIQAGKRTAPREQSPTPMPRIRGAHWNEPPVVSNKTRNFSIMSSNNYPDFPSNNSAPPTTILTSFHIQPSIVFLIFIEQQNSYGISQNIEILLR